VKEASSNEGYEASKEQFLTQYFITKTDSKGGKQSLYIRIVKNYKFTHGP